MHLSICQTHDVAVDMLLCRYSISGYILYNIHSDLFCFILSIKWVLCAHIFQVCYTGTGAITTISKVKDMGEIRLYQIEQKYKKNNTLNILYFFHAFSVIEMLNVWRWLRDYITYLWCSGTLLWQKLTLQFLLQQFLQTGLCRPKNSILILSW